MAEKDARLSRDLGEHRSADMSFVSSTPDQLSELLDPWPMVLRPSFDAFIEILAAAARQKLDPQLLEIAREPCRQ